MKSRQKQRVNGEDTKTSKIEFIRNRMKSKNWKQADLSRSSGVSTGVISRFFNNDGISDKNLFAVMDALDFFKEEQLDKSQTITSPAQPLEIKTLIELLHRQTNLVQEVLAERKRSEEEMWKVINQQKSMFNKLNKQLK